MRRLVPLLSIALFATLLAPVSAPHAYAAPVGTAGRILVFNEEFNGRSLNGATWHTCFWWSSTTCSITTNNELELYRASNVKVRKGNLELIARRRRALGWDGRKYQYTSGMVMTGGRKGVKPVGAARTFGYFEARMKIPAGRGLWPAFWLLPTTYQTRPEVDIMEMLGHRPDVAHFNVHSGPFNVGTSWASGQDLSAGFHTFALDWQPTQLTWLVDGVIRFQTTDPALIPQQPEYMLLNLAVGGNWPGAPDATTRFPAKLLVDWVRVWA